VTPEPLPNDSSSPLPEVAAGLTDLRALAYGGYSTVYRAWQSSVGREVALKVDHRTLEDERDRRRFLREAQAAGRMSGHPHIVHVYDAGVTPDNHPYMVMELCTGGSYAAKLKAQERLSPENVREVGVKIADALDAAHRAGILHRDVKPANILINRYGVPGLADFGLATVHEASRDTSVTVESLTPAYAAPEVFRLEHPGRAGDIYSLGATLYALLSGRPPRWPEHGSLSPVQLVELHNQPLPRLPQIPESLFRVLAKAMASEPADRYETAAQFRDALAALDLLDTAPSTPHASAAPLPAHSFADRVAADHATANDASGPTSFGRSRHALVLFGVLLGLLISVIALGTFFTLHHLDSNAQSGTAHGVICPIKTKQSSCPTAPQCFSQAGRDDSDFGASVPVNCDTPHSWETFAAAKVPASIATPSYEQLRSNAYVVTMCSNETLSRLVKAPTGWKISLLPPTKAEADAAGNSQALQFRCVAGKDQPSNGSTFDRK
jgi:serine/threonine protein kinase